MKPLFQSIAGLLALLAISAAPLHAGTARKDIVETAVAAGSFKTLATALTAAGLVEALKGKGPFTVFAPTDEAFAKLPKGTVESLLKPENKAKLTEILTYHVVAGEVRLSKALELGEAKTVQGSNVTIRFDGGRVKVGEATLATADIKTSNGVIHVIDSVLIPSAPETPAEKIIRVIELAIDRGVPLFNAGQQAACAAIYEVTCEALLAMDGISEKSRADLARALKDARAESSASDKAWILREGLDMALARLHNAKDKANASAAKVLFDFADPAAMKGWEVRNDSVMGGRSESTVEHDPAGSMVFRGNVSLENNGGFASIRNRFDPIDASKYTHAVIRLKGDGKKFRYIVEAEKDAGHYYVAEFTTNGGWQELRIPLREMYAMRRGDRLDIPNFPGKSLAGCRFMVANGRAESFRLEVGSIRLE